MINCGIKGLSGYHNIRVLMIVITIFYCLPLLNNTSVFAVDQINYKKIVRDETIYPRDCRYLLPALLHMDSTERMNLLNLQIASELAKMGVLRLSTQGSIMTISVGDNTSDIVQQNFNMSYELQSLNLILGVWDVEITSEKKSVSGIILSGSKVIKTTTRLYSPVLGLLSPEEKKKYSTMPAKWELTKKDSQIHVAEISSD